MDKNNKKKIVLSLSVLLLLTLAFLGVTYAYYRTRVIGNKSNESISVTSKTLGITYSDNNAAVITGEDIVPSYIASKTFSVTNNGTEEVHFNIIFDNVKNGFNKGIEERGEYNDWVYRLYSGSEKNEESLITTGEITTESTQVLETEVVKGNSTNNYYLEVEYLDLEDINQSADMGQTLSLRLNISEAELINPYNEGTLAYVILNSAVKGLNGTKYVDGSMLGVAENTSAPARVASLKNESVLSSAEDDYGTSYVYRGNVENNYVNFAGMCWRIVRVAGNGNIKLILEDQYTTCDDTETATTSAIYTGNWNIGIGNYGYELKNVDSDSSNEYIMNYLNPVTNNTSSMVKAFYDFQTTKLADYTDKLKAGDWCLGDKAYTRSGSSGSYTYTPLEEYNYSSTMYYDSYVRLIGNNKDGYQPTLKCNGTILNEFAEVSGVSSKAPMYVSAITADEIVYAGGKYGGSNYNYYLMNDYSKDSYSFWSLSPDVFSGDLDYAFRVFYDGHLDSYYVYYSTYRAFRPAVSLASSAVITGGEGTLESPYIIG